MPCTFCFSYSLAAKVLDSWVARTVIRSCAKMAYDHAQKVIELDRDGKDPTGMPSRLLLTLLYNY